MKKRTQHICQTTTLIAMPLLAMIFLLPGNVSGQEEVASTYRRYKAYEESTGYYEQYEVLPGRRQTIRRMPALRQESFAYSTTAAMVRIRTHLADSHQGIRFYENLRCEYCHIDQARDLHTVRANLTCRQCHGGEPIASIDHYYSPMNPIRRHAYVCAKCHEGSSASFATYVVHEPAAASKLAKQTFPALYYAYWFMLVLLVGTLAFFIPHSFLVGLRELLPKWKKRMNRNGT